MQRTRVVGAAAAIAVLLGGAGVALRDTAGDSGSESLRSAASPTTLPVQSAFRDSASVAAAGTGGGAGAAGAPSNDLAATPSPVVPAAQARVVKTATLALSVDAKRVATVADRVASIAAAAGGFVASTERHGGDDKSATLTLRVPASAYDATVSELRGLGKVTSEELGGKDVTGTLVDLDARLRSLRAQEDALNALLGKARTVGETLQVAQAAGEIRTQIEQLAAQQAQLSDQADYATITVQVLGPHASSLSEAKSEPLLVRSFRRAGAGALALVGGVIVVLGYALPLGLMGAAGYLVWRGLRRRRIAAVA